MPLLDMINPYLSSIKIGLFLAALLVCCGAAVYVKSVFQERNTLKTEKVMLQYQLTAEQTKLKVAMDQLESWKATVKQMNDAVRNIKIQSDTYIQGVENEKNPSFNGNDHIDFIVPDVPGVPTRKPGYANISSGRKRTEPASSGLISIGSVLFDRRRS